MRELRNANNQPLKSFLCSWVPQTSASPLLFFWQNHAPVRKRRSRSEMPSELTSQEQKHSNDHYASPAEPVPLLPNTARDGSRNMKPPKSTKGIPCSWCSSDMMGELQRSCPSPIPQHETSAPAFYNLLINQEFFIESQNVLDLKGP